MPGSAFIRAMHPKTEIRSDRESIRKILAAGWVGQVKIHGHRAQIHVPADEDKALIAYTRIGGRHKMELPPRIVAELRRLFTPQKGWNAIDAEWLKPEGKLFVFDVLKHEGRVLSDLTYPERYALLPKAYISPSIKTLPLLKTIEKCLEVMDSGEDHVEGLVFKSTTTEGFADTSIIRCRTKGIR